MIKYLGSKRLLVARIVELVDAIGGVTSVVDLFSGTSRVGHALKAAQKRVLANDHNQYAATLATCYVAADREAYLAAAERLIAELNTLPGKAGWFTETYCEQSRFFQPHNGERVDAIREAIANMSLPPTLEAIALVSLMEAADRVDSTTGVQMAYLKQWATRSYKPLTLRVPDLLPGVPAGPCEAHCLDAHEAIEQLEADVVYFDPPYNQHKYLGNYHIWESLVLWDKPEVYGTAKKRVDCRERGSVFNSRPNAVEAMRSLISRARCRAMVVSFSDEGYIGREVMEEILRSRGEVTTHEVDFKRYVGAQIGIHNPSGERVGTVSHLRNREYIYVVAVNTPPTALGAAAARSGGAR
jgi:adenine-specific DNA-methyltransferase